MSTIQELQAVLKSHLKAGAIKEVFRYMKSHLSSDCLSENRLIALEVNFKINQSHERLALADPASLTRAYQQTTAALLQIIDQLKETDLINYEHGNAS